MHASMLVCVRARGAGGGGGFVSTHICIRMHQERVALTGLCFCARCKNEKNENRWWNSGAALRGWRLDCSTRFYRPRVPIWGSTRALACSRELPHA